MSKQGVKAVVNVFAVFSLEVSAESTVRVAIVLKPTGNTGDMT